MEALIKAVCFQALDEATSVHLRLRLLDAAFFAGEAGLAFAAVAFFGLGALGFFVGTLVTFFTFEAAGAAFFALAAAAFGDLGAFLAAGAFFLAGAAAAEEADAGAARFVAALTDLAFFGLAAAAFLGLAAAFFGFDAAGFAAVAGLALDNLNEPEAPLPLVCTSSPEVTADFKYFLMNGANFSASTL